MREVATHREVLLHGHRIRYRTAGRGPLILLIHGIAGSSATWDELIPYLASDYTVVAPDLLGHGGSAKPRGDYSLGAYASGLRDLMAVLGHTRATVVGHSLGGGVAMQFAYQFPERCERLVLVSSGGLGEEVHAILRAATLPGAEWVLPLMCTAGLRDAVDATAGFLGRIGLRAGADMEEAWRGFCSLGDADARRAFLHTLRTIVDLSGQRVSATDRLYLLDVGLPAMIVWGERDPMIPVAHGRVAHERIAGSRLEVLPTAGHFPHRDEPRRFAELMLDFLETTEPAVVSDDRIHELLRRQAC